MRISEAISPSVPLGVPFANGVVLNIEYRPSSITLAQMEDMLFEAEEAEKAQQAEKDAAKGTRSELEIARERVSGIRTRLIGQAKEVLVSWDLTEEDGTTVVPLEDDGLRKVPLNVFIEIFKSMRKHQSAGDAGKD